jgi:hypothetical protein
MFTTLRSIATAAIAGVALAGSFAGAAEAAQKCGKHEDIVKVLASKYQESRRAMGLVSAQSVMEIYMSPKGTWTMLVSNTKGESCIVAAGEAWQELAIQAAGLDS